MTIVTCCIPTQAGNKVKHQTIKVSAPFEMPDITTPDFSRCRRFDITSFGAVKGDKEKTSAAIAAAIDKANKKGGVVVVPQGEWLTKKIHLKSNVNLHLDKDAVLLFFRRSQGLSARRTHHMGRLRVL